MDLTIKREVFGADDQSWLGSAHGTTATQTVTLDVSTFTKADHYPQGFIPSGTPLGKTGADVNGQPLYGLWEEDASGNPDLVFLFKPVKVPADTSVRVGAAVLEHGRVKVDRLPVTISDDAKATAAGRIIFA